MVVQEPGRAGWALEAPAVPSPSSLAHPRPGAGAGLLGTAAAQNRRGSGSRSLRWELAVSKTRWGLAGLLAARAPCAEHIVGFRSMAGCSGGTRHPSFSVSTPTEEGSSPASPLKHG